MTLKRFIPIFLIVFCGVGICLSGWTLYSSKSLSLSKIVIRIDGFDMDETRILDLVEDHTGQSLLFLPLKRIDTEIRAIPEVKDVELTRRIPGMLEVVATLYRPVVRIACEDQIFFLDDTGTPFRILSDSESNLETIRVILPEGSANPLNPVPKVVRLYHTVARISCFADISLIQRVEMRRGEILFISDLQQTVIRLSLRNSACGLRYISEYFSENPMQNEMEYDLRFDDLLIIRSPKGVLNHG